MILIVLIMLLQEIDLVACLYVIKRLNVVHVSHRISFATNSSLTSLKTGHVCA